MSGSKRIQTFGIINCCVQRILSILRDNLGHCRDQSSLQLNPISFSTKLARLEVKKKLSLDCCVLSMPHGTDLIKQVDTNCTILFGNIRQCIFTFYFCYNKLFIPLKLQPLQMYNLMAAYTLTFTAICFTMLIKEGIFWEKSYLFL